MRTTHFPLLWNGCVKAASNKHACLSPLTEDQAALAEELRAHVLELSVAIGPRNVWHRDSLDAASEFIEETMQSASCRVIRHHCESGSHSVDNIEATLTGHQHPEQIVLIGAHYDSVEGSPGADDNASGVAALLALLRILSARSPARTIRLVAFVNEEPPFFQSARMGSLQYAKQCRRDQQDIVAMISFDGLGFYADTKGSQRFPFPLGMVYPSTGNFIGFVGNRRSRHLLRMAAARFRAHSQFPLESAAFPGLLPGVGGSDHWSFWECGYPGIMVTDTLPYRYPHYHSPKDVPANLDFERMARVVAGMVMVIDRLACPRDLDRPTSELSAL